MSGAIGSGAATGAGIYANIEWARDSLAGTAAGMSLLSAITNYLGGFYAAQYTKECQ